MTAPKFVHIPILTLLLMGVLQCQAQVQWEYLGGPLSSSVYDITFGHDEEMYVTCVAGRDGRNGATSVFRTTDEGYSWELVSNLEGNITRKFTVVSDSTWIIQNWKTICMTDNCGLSWQPLEPPEHAIWSMTTSKSGVVYIERPLMILQHTPYDMRWLPLQLPLAINKSIDDIIRVKDRLYLVTYETVYRRPVKSEAWRVVYNSVYKDLSDFAVAPDNHLYAILDERYLDHSADYGATWQRRDIDFGSVLHITTGYNGIICASLTDANILRSVDYGITWDTLPAFSTRACNINVIKVNQSGSLLIGTSFGLYQYSDSDGSWRRIFSGIGATETITSIDPLYENNLLVSSRSGYHLYNPITAEYNAYEFPHDGNSNQYCVSSVSSGSGLFASSEDTIVKSNDSGRTWIGVPSPIDKYPCYVIELNTSTALYARCTNSIEDHYDYTEYFVSYNHGDTWEQLNCQISGTRRFEVDNNNNIYVQGVLKSVLSSDSGRTWNNLSLPWYMEMSFIGPDDSKFAILLDTIYTSKVLSDDWVAHHFPYSGWVNKLLSRDDVIFLVMHDPWQLGGGVLISFDGGASYQPLNDGLLFRSCTDMIIMDDGYAYVSSSNGLYRSSVPIMSGLDYYRKQSPESDTE
jgi:photosystem II stability/assembly factor-like uncharacterized protein